MSFPLKQWENEWTDFIGNISSVRAQAKILTWIEKLSEDGPNLRRNYKALGEGLFELKIEHERLAYRVMYGFASGAVVLVLCFIKKNQRDQDAIAEARRRLRLIKTGNVSAVDASIH